MVGPGHFLPPTLWIRNTVLTGTFNHKNGKEKQQVLLSLRHKNTYEGRRALSAQVARTVHLQVIE